MYVYDICNYASMIMSGIKKLQFGLKLESIVRSSIYVRY